MDEFYKYMCIQVYIYIYIYLFCHIHWTKESTNYNHTNKAYNLKENQISETLREKQM